MQEIHQSLVDSPHKGTVTQTFDVSFLVSLNKLLNIHRCFYTDTVWCRSSAALHHNSTLRKIALQFQVKDSNMEWLSL